MNLLTNDEANQLREAGYTDWEIDLFSNAKTPDGKDQPPINLSSEVWIAAMEDRRKWKDDLLSKGWTEEQFERNIYDQYNRDPNQSPWDFLKKEYKPPQKPRLRSTLEATARVRNFKNSVNRSLRTKFRKIADEDQSFFEETLGETIRRLNREGR